MKYFLMAACLNSAVKRVSPDLISSIQSDDVFCCFINNLEFFIPILYLDFVLRHYMTVINC